MAPEENDEPKTPNLNTLAIDIGGTGLKASVLDGTGKMLTERVRVATTYPVSPTRMVHQLTALVAPLPDFGRVSVGFPGVVRAGRIRTAPHFVTVSGPGSAVDPVLHGAWAGFELAGVLDVALGKPVRVLNDADLQGLDVVTGHGVEVVITLGTGFGSAVFADGVLGAHLELAQHPFRRGDTYNEYLGDAARKRIGAKKWNRRVGRAVGVLQTLFTYDHLYVGGGNARHLRFALPGNVSVIDPNAGILGGVHLWERDGLFAPTPR